MTDTSTTAAPADAEVPAKPPARSPEEIKADLERARQSLVAGVDQLQEYVKPSNVAARGRRRFRRVFVADDGRPNVKAIAVTAAVVGILVLYRIRK